MSGKITILKGENLTLTTAVRMLAALQTAAVNSLAAQVRVKRLEIGPNSATLGVIRGEISTRDTAGTLTTTSLAPTNVKPIGGPASGLAGNTSVIGGVGRSGINATVDSGGTYTQVMPFSFPCTAGYLFKPEPDEELTIPPSTVAVVRFLADPAALTGWTFCLWLVEE